MKENTTAAERGAGGGREGTHGRIRVFQKMRVICKVHSPFIGIDVLFHEGDLLGSIFFFFTFNFDII